MSKRMDINKEIVNLQTKATDNMKRYADDRIQLALRALRDDNPSLLMDDMLQSLSRREILYGCIHERCSRPATLRGYCENHSKKTPYEMVSGDGVRKNMFSF